MGVTTEVCRGEHEIQKAYFYTHIPHFFLLTLGKKVLNTVEVDKNPTLATTSTSDLAKNAYAPY